MARDEERHDPKITVGEHLDELRRRVIYALVGLIVAIGVSAIFGQELLPLLRRPFDRVMVDMNLQPELKLLEVTAGFTTYLKIVLIAGLLLSSPWVFYHIWRFVSVGLYPRERRAVLWALPASVGLFVAGALLFLLVFSAYMLKFFIGFATWMGLDPQIRFQDYVGFMTTMMLVFGVGFQTPLVVLALARMGLVKVSSLNHYRRHVVISLLIFAALLTPPDPFSQLSLAIPMWLLYELGVLLAWLSMRKRSRR